MPDLNVCPNCNHSKDTGAETCSYCEDASHRTPGPKDPEITPDPILLRTHPDPRSFMYKYVLACFPIFLVIISVFVRSLLGGVTSSIMPGITGATGSLSTGIPGITGSLNSLTPAVTGITTISIFLVAPIGIFIVVAGIGWAMRLTELWTSTAITLGLSIMTGMIMMSGTGIPLVSERYIADLVQWIAYLVQPFCIIAAIVILIWTEKFRWSLMYTVTKDNIAIEGGVWKHQEHLIPHHQIGRVVLEQDAFGRIFNYGTVIPQSISRWGAETSFRGVGASGQKDNVGAMIGYAKGREEASRYPLDCFYGIPDPHKAQQILSQLMVRPATREEEQVMLLEKIYDKI